MPCRRAGTPRIVRAGPSSVKGTRRSFLTASQKRSSGPTLGRLRLRGSERDPTWATVASGSEEPLSVPTLTKTKGRGLHEELAGRYSNRGGWCRIAAPAFAGEITGNGKPTQGPAHANSICVFSGQNDDPTAPIISAAPIPEGAERPRWSDAELRPGRAPRLLDHTIVTPGQSAEVGQTPTTRRRSSRSELAS